MAGGFFTEANSAETVIGRNGPDADPRLVEVMSALVRHLHAFAKEVHLTQVEWEIGIDFLTRTGQLCGPERQEFILLSDTLGLSMLVDAINNRRPPGATENTVFGPFHVDDAPRRQMGDNVNMDGKGEPCLYEGRVLDLEGNPIAGAVVDVWSDSVDGFYDVCSSRASSPRATTAASLPPGQTGGTGSPGSSLRPTRSPTTARWARCWPGWDGTPTARRTCISW
jgi:hydroxyquinol 1,2-dioxygenase